ncbi:hypothetical protein C8C78_12237 [Halanaerobium congolense]|uniref:Uncharacterized protein n=1 Tax=Halanaerobium congolense TaxID=54121 RepID=A0A318DZR6_9FIRM|nr:hypothetical protein [Halanaerobium congolense]PXV63679.1 hypothetical protein C8C78_12237 [Halanaerobium congolense]
MNLLNQISLYKVLNISEKIEAENLLDDNKEKINLNCEEIKNSSAVGDIILLIKNNRDQSLEKRKVINYPVKKIKGRYSDVKEYIYFKMKVLYDFNLHYLNKKEIEAVPKDPDHLKFENLLDKNQKEIKKLITYNSDENVKPFNHTNYPVQKILNSKKIFRQEIGNEFDWGWSLMEIYKINPENFVSFKQSSYFRERQRGEFFDISKKTVEFMRTFEDDKNDFLD